MHTRALTHSHTHMCVCTHRHTGSPSWTHWLPLCPTPVHCPGPLHFLPGPRQQHGLPLGPSPHCFLDGWFPTSAWSLLGHHLLSPIRTPLFQLLSPCFFFYSTNYILPALLAFLILCIVYCLPFTQESQFQKGRNFCFVHWHVSKA